MPALPPVPKVLRLDYHWGYGEDLFARTRWFYSYTGSAPSNADLVTMANAVMTDADTNLKPLMNTQVSIGFIVITDLTSPTSAVGISTHAAIVGTRSGGSLPADTALLYSLGVHRRFRGGHCRVYWPLGGGNDYADPQKWTTSFVSAATTGLNAHVSAIEGAGWSGAGTLENVLVSYYQGFVNHTGTTGRTKPVNTPRSSPLIDTIATAIVQIGIASIRKRLLALA